MKWDNNLERMSLNKAIENQRAKELMQLLRMVQVRNCILSGVPVDRLDRDLEEILHEKGES